MTDSDKLDLKKRARRRLVGAAALALLAAILLPMVMDSEPAPPTQDVQVVIPDQSEARLAVRPIGPALSEAPPFVIPPAEPADPAAGLPPLVPQVPPPAPLTPAAEGEIVEYAEPVPATAAATPSSAPASAPSRPSSSTASPGPAAEAARVEAILSGQLAAAPRSGAQTAQPAQSAAAAPRTSGVVVQVGAFRDAQVATRLRDQLRTAGYQAYTEPAGETTRVRVGPYPSRAAAEEALARLRTQGHDGVLANR